MAVEASLAPDATATDDDDSGSSPLMARTDASQDHIVVATHCVARCTAAGLDLAAAKTRKEVGKRTLNSRYVGRL